MRAFVSLLAAVVCVGCGPESGHPAAAPACDEALMSCRTYTPPEAGGVAGGNQAGGGSGGGDEVAAWSGRVLAFTDDYFDEGLPFVGMAEVSATGQNGSRVKGSYDGRSFELQGVLKEAGNWFMVTPQASTGALPTLTLVDTRVASDTNLGIGMARVQDVDGILSQVGAERSAQRAQVALHVVDEQGRSVAGVLASLTAERTAYRLDGVWTLDDSLGSDDSGAIFLANVPASSSLSTANVIFGGAVSARVEIRILAGATTVVTAIVSPP